MLPETPHGNVAKIECVPVQIEHLRIERDNAFACDTRRRRNEGSKVIVDTLARGAVGARKKVPDGERIASTRL